MMNAEIFSSFELSNQLDYSLIFKVQSLLLVLLALVCSAACINTAMPSLEPPLESICKQVEGSPQPHHIYNENNNKDSSLEKQPESTYIRCIRYMSDIGGALNPFFPVCCLALAVSITDILAGY